MRGLKVEGSPAPLRAMSATRTSGSMVIVMTFAPGSCACPNGTVSVGRRLRRTSRRASRSALPVLSRKETTLPSRGVDVQRDLGEGLR